MTIPVFAYDQAGNLRMRTDRLDRVYVLSYDRLNRLTREDWWQIEDFPTVSIVTTTEGSGSTNEVQDVSLSNATTGYYRLLLDGYFTAPIAHDASSSAIRFTVEAAAEEQVPLPLDPVWWRCSPVRPG